MSEEVPPAVTEPVAEIPVPPPGPVEAAEPPLASHVPEKPLFPIGVFVPQVVDFDKWKSRGINTVVMVPEGHDPFNWSYQSVLKGFWQVRSSVGNYANADGVFAKDAEGTPNLLAWVSRLSTDEPERTKKASSSQLRAEYGLIKAVDASRPVFANYSGSYLIGWQPGVDREAYRQYTEAADIVSQDIYPVTGWNQPHNLVAIADAMDALADVAHGKPAWAVIETSNQRLKWVGPNARGVTVGEFVAEVFLALINGAKGIVYFPVEFNPWGFDGTPDAVALAMAELNNWITNEWAGFLVNGERRELSTGNPYVQAAAFTLGGQELRLSINWSTEMQTIAGVTFAPLQFAADIKSREPAPEVEPVTVLSDNPQPPVPSDQHELIAMIQQQVADLAATVAANNTPAEQQQDARLQKVEQGLLQLTQALQTFRQAYNHNLGLLQTQIKQATAAHAAGNPTIAQFAAQVAAMQAMVNDYAKETRKLRGVVAAQPVALQQKVDRIVRNLKAVDDGLE